MIKRRNITFKLFTLATMASLTACGGGGGGDDSSSVSLTGTWGGKYDLSGYTSSLSVGVDGMSVTSVSVDGTDQYLTGTIIPLQGDVYEFTLYSGSTEADSGGFLVDSAGNHAGFLTAGGDFGVLQKNSSGNATWTPSDAVATWSGYSIALDYNGNITSYGTSSATVQADGSVTGTGPFGNFTATLVYYDPSSGSYWGTWSNPTQADSGDLKVWVSADKKFAASYACSGTNVTPSMGLYNCTYNSWTKQQ